MQINLFYRIFISFLIQKRGRNRLGVGEKKGGGCVFVCGCFGWVGGGGGGKVGGWKEQGKQQDNISSSKSSISTRS